MSSRVQGGTQCVCHLSSRCINIMTLFLTLHVCSLTFACFQNNQPTDPRSELYTSKESSDKSREAGSKGTGILCTREAPTQGIKFNVW